MNKDFRKELFDETQWMDPMSSDNDGEPVQAVQLGFAEELVTEIERLRKDAERYRWLREDARTGTGEPFIARSCTSGFSAWTKQFADEVIDEAMNAKVGSKLEN